LWVTFPANLELDSMESPISDKLRILIVDDNHLNFMMMKNMFSFQNYEVHFAECGMAALDMARKYLPDFILLDVVMPDISGFEVCRLLKSDPKFGQTSVIFVSAASEIDFIVNAIDAGGVDFVSKPFRKEELFSRIEKHLAKKPSASELSEKLIGLQKIVNMQVRMFSLMENDLLYRGFNIRMIFEFLAKGLIDPTRNGQFQSTVYGLLDHLEKSIAGLENLSDWVLSESGTQKYEPENIHLMEAVTSLLNLHQLGIQSKKIRLKLRIDDAHVVFADQMMLKTILRNIISNAVEFTSHEGTITIESCSKPGFIKMRVLDTERAAKHELSEKKPDMDNSFSDLNFTRELMDRPGLKLCIDFIEKCGGRMWMEHTRIKGTSISFTLPSKNENSYTDDPRSLVW
jgi:two-component system, sensor histidine kinase and response regulator